MKKLSMRLLVVVLALSAGCLAEEWHKTYQLSGSPQLAVSTSDASVTVDTWDQNTVDATVRTEGWKIGNGGIQIIESQTGNSVNLEVRYPHEFHLFISVMRHVEVIVHLPRQGRVDLRTSDGRIRLSGLHGDMRVRSSDGSQEIENVDGTLDSSASDGMVHISGRFDRLSARTSDGSIEIRALPGSKVSGEWSVTTSDGGMRLYLPVDLAADVEAHSGDGHIDFDLPVTVSGSMRANSVRGKLNGGGGLLLLRSGDGSIHVGRG